MSTPFITAAGETIQGLAQQVTEIDFRTGGKAALESALATLQEAVQTAEGALKRLDDERFQSTWRGIESEQRQRIGLPLAEIARQSLGMVRPA